MAVVDLGQVCAGLPARGGTPVDLPGASRHAHRQLRSGTPATHLQLFLRPVQDGRTRHRLDVPLQPARSGLIDRALALPGEHGADARQVRICAHVVDCGVPVDDTARLAEFLGSRAAEAPADAAPAASLSPLPAAAAVAPRARTASLADRRQATRARCTWCETRTDPYDTLHPGSGFVPLPWLSRPGWVHVSTEFDQARPGSYLRPVWTRVESLPSTRWPRYRMPTWTRVGSIGSSELPRVRPVGSYTVDDCRLQLWDDYFRWAAAHEGRLDDGAGTPDGVNTPAATAMSAANPD